MESIKAAMDDLKKQQLENSKDWFTPDDLDREWKPEITRTQANGLQMVIVGMYTAHHVEKVERWDEISLD